MTTSSLSSTVKPVFILIHGAWFGSFAWKKVTPLLQAKGYRVLTPDLPGYGNDKQPLTDLSLDDYVKKITGIAYAIEEPVILVGHSMGGAVITQVAEVLGPGKVSSLVFLDAFLLADGESIMEQVAQLNEAASDPVIIQQKKLATNFLVISEDGKFGTVSPENMVEVFCHDCPSGDQALLTKETVWQPLAVLTQKVSVTDERYGVIPKIYIQCTDARDLDRTSILQHVYCQKIYTLPSSHSPFFSMPEKLVAMLDEIAQPAAVLTS